MDIHEVRHVFVELIASELLEAHKACEELGRFAKSWSPRPRYPNIPKEAQITENVSLYVWVSDDKPILLCGFGNVGRALHDIELTRSVANDILLRVEYEPKEVVRILKIISDFKKWALWAKGEIENRIRRMFEEQREYVDQLMAEWSIRSLSK